MINYYVFYFVHILTSTTCPCNINHYFRGITKVEVSFFVSTTLFPIISVRKSPQVLMNQQPANRAGAAIYGSTSRFVAPDLVSLRKVEFLVNKARGCCGQRLFDHLVHMLVYYLVFLIYSFTTYSQTSFLSLLHTEGFQFLLIKRKIDRHLSTNEIQFPTMALIQTSYITRYNIPSKYRTNRAQCNNKEGSRNCLCNTIRISNLHKWGGAPRLILLTVEMQCAR